MGEGASRQSQIPQGGQEQSENMSALSWSPSSGVEKEDLLHSSL